MDLISRADAIEAVTKLCVDGYKAKVDGYFIPLTDALINTLSALPSAELVLQTPQTYGKSINPSNAVVVEDLIRRADAIEAVRSRLYQSAMNNDGEARETFADIAENRIELWINEVPSAVAVSHEEYEETDGVVKIKKQSAKEVGEIKHIVVCSPNYTRYFYNESMPLPSADAVPTVIRAKTFIRKEDFDKWAEDIKRQNKSIVCIPCDAEVVSADAVQGEWVDWLGNGNEWECSVCKCSIESHGNIAYKYCPMCGARMKGGDTE